MQGFGNLQNTDQREKLFTFSDYFKQSSSAMKPSHTNKNNQQSSSEVEPPLVNENSESCWMPVARGAHPSIISSNSNYHYSNNS